MFKRFRRVLASRARIPPLLILFLHSIENLYIFVFVILGTIIFFEYDFTAMPIITIGFMLSCMFVAFVEGLEVCNAGRSLTRANGQNTQLRENSDGTDQLHEPGSFTLRKRLTRVNDFIFDISGSCLLALAVLFYYDLAFYMYYDNASECERVDGEEAEYYYYNDFESREISVGDSVTVLFDILEWFFLLSLILEIFSSLGEVTPATLFYLALQFVVLLLFPGIDGETGRCNLQRFLRMFILLAVIVIISPFVVLLFATDTRHPGHLHRRQQLPSTCLLPRVQPAPSPPRH